MYQMQHMKKKKVQGVRQLGITDLTNKNALLLKMEKYVFNRKLNST